MSDAAERQGGGRGAEGPTGPAAQALQAAIERYGEGDLDGAAALLAEVLRLQPAHGEARRYQGWIQRCLRLRAEEGRGLTPPLRTASSRPVLTPLTPLPAPSAPPASSLSSRSSSASLGRGPSSAASSPSADSPLSGFTGVLATSVAEALREAEARGNGAASPGASPPLEIDPDLGYRVEIDATPELSLDPAADGDGDLNLTDLVAEAAQWSAASEERPDLDEAGLISISDELIEGELPGGGPATETPFAPLAFRERPRSVVHVNLETGRPEPRQREAPPAPAAPPAQPALPGVPALRDGGLQLSDEPHGPPPEELLIDDDLELISEAPPPAGTSPLVAEELFAGIADPEPSQPSRPLVARPKASITPDFVVDFEDVLSSAPAPAPAGAPTAAAAGAAPSGPPPAPQRHKPPPQLEEAGRALGRGDAETAYRMVEQLIEQAGGDPSAAPLRPYQGLIAAVYEGMLRPLDRVPRTGRLPRDLEPASAFLLSLLDGSMSIEDALTVSGMDRLRGARSLVALMRRGLLTF